LFSLVAAKVFGGERKTGGAKRIRALVEDGQVDASDVAELEKEAGTSGKSVIQGMVQRCQVCCWGRKTKNWKAVFTRNASGARIEVGKADLNAMLLGEARSGSDRSLLFLRMGA